MSHTPKGNMNMERHKKYRIMFVLVSFVLAVTFSNLSDLFAADMKILIIGSKNFNDQMELLKNWEKDLGGDVYVLKLEDIYNDSQYQNALDYPEKVKLAIKKYYDNYEVKYVVLVGDADRFPVRWIRLMKGAYPVWGEWLKTDQYYADLYDENGAYANWDGNGNGLVGEIQRWNPINADMIEGVPEVYVGRIPASNKEELINYIYKVIRYEYFGNDTKKAVFVAPSWKNDKGEYHDVGGLIDDVFEPGIKDALDPNNITTLRYYDPRIKNMDTDAVPDMWEEEKDGLSKSETVASVINEQLNSGALLLGYGGHGNLTLWSKSYKTDFFRTDYKEKMVALNNETILPVVFADACITGQFVQGTNSTFVDKNQNKVDGSKYKDSLPPEPHPIQLDNPDSMAEYWTVKYPYGAIAYLGVMGFGNSMTEVLAVNLIRGLFQKDHITLGEAHAYMMSEYRKYYGIDSDKPYDKAKANGSVWAWRPAENFYHWQKMPLYGAPFIKFKKKYDVSASKFSKYISDLDVMLAGIKKEEEKEEGCWWTEGCWMDYKPNCIPYCTCSDSDPQNNIHIEGDVEIADVNGKHSFNDMCEGNILAQYGCDENNELVTTAETCPEGEVCNFFGTICEKSKSNMVCVDTDYGGGGDCNEGSYLCETYVAGKVIINVPSAKATLPYTEEEIYFKNVFDDYCDPDDKGIVVEQTCSVMGAYPEEDKRKCPDGTSCVYGACHKNYCGVSEMAKYTEFSSKLFLRLNDYLERNSASWGYTVGRMGEDEGVYLMIYKSKAFYYYNDIFTTEDYFVSTDSDPSSGIKPDGEYLFDVASSNMRIIKDFNYDSYPDILTPLTSSKPAKLYLTNYIDSGDVESDIVDLLAVQFPDNVVDAVDVDGNGEVDIVGYTENKKQSVELGYPNDNIYVYFGTKPNKYSNDKKWSASAIPNVGSLPTVEEFKTAFVRTGKFNGDDKLDILVINKRIKPDEKYVFHVFMSGEEKKEKKKAGGTSSFQVSGPKSKSYAWFDKYPVIIQKSGTPSYIKEFKPYEYTAYERKYLPKHFGSDIAVVDDVQVRDLNGDGIDEVIVIGKTADFSVVKENELQKSDRRQENQGQRKDREDKENKVAYNKNPNVFTTLFVWNGDLEGKESGPLDPDAYLSFDGYSPEGARRLAFGDVNSDNIDDLVVFKYDKPNKFYTLNFLLGKKGLGLDLKDIIKNPMEQEVEIEEDKDFDKAAPWDQTVKLFDANGDGCDDIFILEMHEAKERGAIEAFFYDDANVYYYHVRFIESR